MAGSFLHRAMVQLGLVDDDEYDDYDVYDEPHPVAQPSAGPRPRPVMEGEPTGQVRALPRDFDNGGVTLQQTRPAVVRPVPARPPPVHVVSPRSFGDAREIGDLLKNGGPVSVNLQDVEPDLSRRLIDFC